MKRLVLIVVTGLTFSLVSLPGNADVHDHDPVFSNLSLQGIKTIAVEIDPPPASFLKLHHFSGVSAEELHAGLSRRLHEAGFNVVSYEEALKDPDAALVYLKIWLTPMAALSIYGYNLELSLKQKVPYKDDLFYSIDTWSDGACGVTQKYQLGYLYDYSLILVDHLIADYEDDY